MMNVDVDIELGEGDGNQEYADLLSDLSGVHRLSIIEDYLAEAMGSVENGYLPDEEIWKPIGFEVVAFKSEFIIVRAGKYKSRKPDQIQPIENWVVHRMEDSLDADIDPEEDYSIIPKPFSIPEEYFNNWIIKKYKNQ
jgi:hypothetical protein